MPQSLHDRAAELHNLAAHAHQAAAASHGKGSLTAHELSRKAHEHSSKAFDESQKAAETGSGAPSVLDGVVFGQPALSLAAQLQRRAGRAGFRVSVSSSLGWSLTRRE